MGSQRRNSVLIQGVLSFLSPPFTEKKSKFYHWLVETTERLNMVFFTLTLLITHLCSFFTGMTKEGCTMGVLQAKCDFENILDMVKNGVNIPEIVQ